MLAGTRIAVIVGVISAFMVVFVGANVGLLAGYYGGWLDEFLMRLTDIAYGIPFLPMAIVLMSLLERGVSNIIVVIVLLFWRTTSRVIRSQVLTIKERPFINSARVAGAGNLRIIYRHIAPNVMPMTFLYISFAIGWAAGGGLGGVLYERIGSKFKLARQYMVDHLGMDADFVMDEGKLPKEQVMQTVARALDTGDGPAVQQSLREWWNSVDVGAIPASELAATIDEGFAGVLGHLEPATVDRATQVLWELHHPYMVWVYLGVMGLLGTVGMIIFYFVTRKSLAAEAEANVAQP